MSEFVAMTKIAERFHKSPFDPDFLAQWNNFEQRFFLELSLEIPSDTEIIIKTLNEKLPNLLVNLADIVGTSLYNVWVKKGSQTKHLIKQSEKKETAMDKITLPDGRTINIVKPKGS